LNTDVSGLATSFFCLADAVSLPILGTYLAKHSGVIPITYKLCGSRDTLCVWQNFR